MQYIHCGINNCHYWSEGNKCTANEIVIVSDRFGNTVPDSIDATMVSTINPTSVNSCMETCCKTFVEKGPKHIKSDEYRTK